MAITLSGDGIARANLAADVIDSTKLADDAVDTEHLADDAVGVAELSATGTASSSTFLRGDNSWQSAADATKLPLAGGTMSGDLILEDNVKIELGNASGGDLQIYHNASNSYISDQGTGHLKILGTNIVMMNAAEDKNYLYATDGDSVSLYFNNAAKLATSNTGITVTGAIAGATNLGKVLSVTTNTLAGDGSATSTATGFTETGIRVVVSAADVAAANKLIFMFNGNVRINRAASHAHADFRIQNDDGVDFKEIRVGGAVNAAGEVYASVHLQDEQDVSSMSGETEYMVTFRKAAGTSTYSADIYYKYQDWHGTVIGV